MAEYIDKEALRDLMYTEAFERDTGLQRWDSGLWIRYKLFENCLEAIPSVDAVEVVRCRDCVFGNMPCAMARYPDYFCADGKRKGGQDNE